MLWVNLVLRLFLYAEAVAENPSCLPPWQASGFGYQLLSLTKGKWGKPRPSRRCTYRLLFLFLTNTGQLNLTSLCSFSNMDMSNRAITIVVYPSCTSTFVFGAHKEWLWLENICSWQCCLNGGLHQAYTNGYVGCHSCMLLGPLLFKKGDVCTVDSSLHALDTFVLRRPIVHQIWNRSALIRVLQHCKPSEQRRKLSLFQEIYKMSAHLWISLLQKASLTQAF